MLIYLLLDDPDARPRNGSPLDEVQTLEQQWRNHATVAPGIPDPIVYEDEWCRRSLVEIAALSLEGKRNDEQIEAIVCAWIEPSGNELHRCVHEASRHRYPLFIAVDDHDLRVRQELAEDQGRARKDTAAHDTDASDSLELG